MSQRVDQEAIRGSLLFVFVSLLDIAVGVGLWLVNAARVTTNHPPALELDRDWMMLGYAGLLLGAVLFGWGYRRVLQRNVVVVAVALLVIRFGAVMYWSEWSIQRARVVETRHRITRLGAELDKLCAQHGECPPSLGAVRVEATRTDVWMFPFAYERSSDGQNYVLRSVGVPSWYTDMGYVVGEENSLEIGRDGVDIREIQSVK